MEHKGSSTGFLVLCVLLLWCFTSFGSSKQIKPDQRCTDSKQTPLSAFGATVWHKEESRGEKPQKTGCRTGGVSDHVAPSLPPTRGTPTSSFSGAHQRHLTGLFTNGLQDLIQPRPIKAPEANIPPKTDQEVAATTTHQHIISRFAAL